MSAVQIAKKAPAFLLKTYEILQRPDYQDVVRWNEEGTGFVILSPEGFSGVVLPYYFKHSNMHSFIRQLNMYGFSKKRDKNHNYYHHPLFLKGKSHLIAQIQRKVEHKTPKNTRTSTASIQAQLPERTPGSTLLQMNYFLLMEQAANLQMFLNDLNDNTPKKEQLQNMVKQYLNVHGKLIQKVKDEDKGDGVQSTREILEKTAMI